MFLYDFMWFMFLEAFFLLALCEGNVVAKVAVCWSSKLRGKIKSNQVIWLVLPASADVFLQGECTV